MKLEYFKNQFGVKGPRLHLNNAGLAPISKPAMEKAKYWAQRFYEEGFYTDADYMHDVFLSRKSVSQIVGTNIENVAFFQSTSNAISQIAFSYPLESGDEVIMWEEEYSSHLYPWLESCKQKNAKIILVPHLDTPYEKLIEKITSKTKVIAISWVQYISGAITDLKSLAKITNEKGIFLAVDIMQGLGFKELKMDEWGIDIVYGGSHKWLVSPVGVGFLALNSKHLKKIKPHNFGSGTYGTCDDPASLVCIAKNDASKFESGAKQVLEITALGASIDLILNTGVDIIGQEISRLSKKLADEIETKFNLTTTHYRGSSIVNFIPSSKEMETQLLKIPCLFAKRGGGIRLSPHAFNTDFDIDQVLLALGRQG